MESKLCALDPVILAAFAVAMGLISQVREVIVMQTISARGAIVVGLGTAFCYVSLSIVVAATWRFPVPFGFVISVVPVVSFFTIFMCLVIGPRVLAQPPVLRQQIKSQMVIVVMQGVLGIIYPVFSAIFNRLSGSHQTAFILLMPIMKFVTKQTIAIAADGLQEYVGPIVVFSVDVFNVLYVSICMQAATSTSTALLIVAADSFHVLVALHAIFRRAHVIPVTEDNYSTGETTIQQPTHYLQDLPVMLHIIFPEALTAKARGRPIRIFAPFPLQLSSASVAFMNEIARSRRESHIYSSSRVQTKSNVENFSGTQSMRSLKGIKELGSTKLETDERKSRSDTTISKKNQVVPANLTFDMCFNAKTSHRTSSRKDSTSRLLLSFAHSQTSSASTTALRSALTRSATEEAVSDALQTLFHSEYLLLAEYIEFMLPMLYAMYLTLVYHLPVAKYYPHTASLTPHRLTTTVASILAFSAVEFVAFLVLLILLGRKLGFSPLYQLAFVLETQIHTLQGHLFVWTIYILHLTLVHYGVKF